MKKIRIGVLGAYRGSSMISYCKKSDNAEVVAICDKWKEGLERQKQVNEGLDITYYESFDDFINHDMDAVVLANYATEHAPFAIRCLKKGLHVFSEVLPVQTLKEAVELIEAVEQSGKVYAYGENYCFMPISREMRKLYQEGKLGELQYAEGEYLHNCGDIWHCLTYGERDHWRNTMYSTFYCTHSIGPIIHATKLRPVSVTGFELDPSRREYGKRGGSLGIEMVTLENGAILRSCHGGLSQDNVWFNLYGTKGHIESMRKCLKDGDYNKVVVKVDGKDDIYMPNNDLAGDAGHGGSDFWSMYHFINKINGDENAETIDVYEALDMSLCGIFAYRSILNGGIPMQIPNLRNKEERDKWRNDTACTDPKVAGDQLIPAHSRIDDRIPDCVYDNMQKRWIDEFNSKQGYSYRAFRPSDKNKIV